MLKQVKYTIAISKIELHLFIINLLLYNKMFFSMFRKQYRIGHHLFVYKSAHFDNNWMTKNVEVDDTKEHKADFGYPGMNQEYFEI